MWTYLVTFCSAAAVALGLTPLLRRFALHYELVDDPSAARKVHQVPIPRIGGIAIAAGFFVPVFGLLLLDNPISQAFFEHPSQTVALVGGALAMVLLGLADDLRHLGPKPKLIVQIAVASAAYALGYQVDTLGFLLGDLHLGWWSYPITLLWIVGLVNAVNLLDGIDGLAGGMALFTVSTLFAIGVTQYNPVMSMTSIALAGALVGFLRYNFNPASIFMGDSGSLFLGYVLAVTSLVEGAKSTTVLSLSIPMLALGLPILDTSLAIVRRFLSGRDIFAADRQHIHHQLLDMGYSQRQAVFVLYGFCALLSAAAFANVYTTRVQTAVLLGLVFAVTLVFARLMGGLSWQGVNRRVRYGWQRQQRFKVHLHELERVALRIAKAPNTQAVVACLHHVAQVLDVDELHLHAQVSPGAVEVATQWTRPQATPQGPNAPRAEICHTLDWSLGQVGIQGSLVWVWHCDPANLQLPEAPGYRLLALATRDRLMALATA